MTQGYPQPNMHKTTVMITHSQRDYIETWCFEHGLSFAAWVRLQISEKQRQEQERLNGTKESQK